MVLNMEKNIDLERKNNNEIKVLYAIWKNITESTTEKKFDKPYAYLCTVFSCE